MAMVPTKPRYGHFTKMGGLKLYPPILKYMGLDGLVEVKQRKNLTVSYSPFGWVDEGGTVFVKGAPVNKGVPYAELTKLGDVGTAIKDGLDKCIAMTKRHREEGLSLIHI